MGLFFSDTMPIDPMLEDTVRLQDNLTEYAYATELYRDGYEYEAANLIR